MKVKNILNLSIEEFENLLSKKNYNWIIEKYKYAYMALQMYQDGAQLSGQDDYLEVNEYFELIRGSQDDIENYKNM